MINTLGQLTLVSLDSGLKTWGFLSGMRLITISDNARRSMMIKPTTLREVRDTHFGTIMVSRRSACRHKLIFINAIRLVWKWLPRREAILSSAHRAVRFCETYGLGPV